MLPSLAIGEVEMILFRLQMITGNGSMVAQLWSHTIIYTNDKYCGVGTYLGVYMDTHTCLSSGVYLGGYKIGN